MQRLLVVLAFTLGIGLTMPARVMFAHHAFAAEFDAKQPIELKGTVAKMDWVNPHAWLYIDVKGPDGKVVNWALEFGSPNALYKRGFRKETLPVGTEVAVSAYRAKNGTPTAHAEKVRLLNGTDLFNASSGTGTPYPQ